MLYKQIHNQSTQVKDQAHGFKAQNTQQNSKNFVKDKDTLTFVAKVYLASKALVELEYDLGTLLASLFKDILDNSKTRISLVIPVLNLEKEEAKTLTAPLAAKQGKSPTSAFIPQRRGVAVQSA